MRSAGRRAQTRSGGGGGRSTCVDGEAPQNLNTKFKPGCEGLLTVFTRDQTRPQKQGRASMVKGSRT